MDRMSAAIWSIAHQAPGPSSTESYNRTVEYAPRRKE